MQNVEYILGHSDTELRRLMYQAAIIRPITERLLHEAGIAPGMRVLDVGSGTGDVAMLAAELVGPDGAVVGIDRSSDAVDKARLRAEVAGHRNIRFIEGAVEEATLPAMFDFAIGRYVLIHQADPASFIRTVASHVRPGGVVAFHEVAIYGDAQSLPPVELFTQVWQWILDAFHSAMVHPDAGGRMFFHFRAAGLGDPAIFCEIPVGSGRDSPFYGWVAMTLRTLLPQLEKIGATTATEVDIDTLEERLLEAVLQARAQLLGPMQFCGWSRRGDRRDH